MNRQLEQAKARIAAIAGDMLKGSTSFIVGSRQISRLRYYADLEWDSDIVPFVGIDSETDALPVETEIRALWLQSALDKIQPEIDRAEVWAREFALRHCENLVARFGGHESGSLRQDQV